MTRNTTTLALLALAGSAGIASAQRFIPMNAPGKNYNEGRSNTAANGIITFQGQRDNGDPIAGMWDWRTDTVYEMPMPTDGGGNPLEVVSYQFRPSPGGRPFRGQTIPGIDIIIKKTPGGKAAYWDTRASDEGVIVDLDNAWGVESWATNANADGTIIAGAVYGDIDGNGPARRAVKWADGGGAELMPVPSSTTSSEVWWTGDEGDIALGAIGTRGTSSDPDKPKLKPSVEVVQKGIIWDLRDDSYRVIEPGDVGAVSLVLSALSSDSSHALTWTAHDDETTKGGVYELANDTYMLLDGGDINGDGQVDFADRHDSATFAMSADGSVIGGSYTLPGGDETAAFWTASDGYQMHDLAQYLQAEGVTDVDGWSLTSVTAVSADGMQFSGWGYNPAGQADVWVALIPAPGSVALLGLSGLLAARRSRR